MKYQKQLVIDRLKLKAQQILEGGKDAQRRAERQHLNSYGTREEARHELHGAWGELLAVMDDFNEELDGIKKVDISAREFHVSLDKYRRSLNKCPQEIIERANSEAAKISGVIELLENSDGTTVSSTEMKDLGAFRWIKLS